MIKCDMCKLDVNTCDYLCTKVKDTSSLLKENKDEKDPMDGFCTNHTCEHNAGGFKCTLSECIYM